MAEVRLEKVAKSYGAVSVLHDVDVHVHDGEFMTFVGPSGCGKSTLLRLIAGLEEITRGDCLIDGRRVNDEEPAQRGIAMVFQSYALYPHMSLYDNMAFAMRLARTPRQVVEDTVREAARKLRIDTLLERKPRQLSGGQRQRVAIGRAITRNPKVFLFDEPLSNLDAELRVKMRIEFAKLHRELGATTIYVTHDQVEAMTLSSRIVVLDAGRVAQIGSPLALYHHPANRFVAGFIGSPRMNFIEGRLLGGGPEGAEVELAGGTRVRAAVNVAGAVPGSPVALGVRPENLGAEGDHARVPATVTVVEPLGDVSFVHLEAEGCPEGLSARMAPGTALRPGQRVQLTLPAAHMHLFDGHGQAYARLNETDHLSPTP